MRLHSFVNLGALSAASRGRPARLRQLAQVLAVGCVLGLYACGGGGDSPPPAAATVGAAGGSVADPGGARVVVPPGALAQDVAIAVTPSSAGAPPLPAGVTALGPIIAFTPHGTAFAVPATITVPFDPALLAAGEQPVLYKTPMPRRPPGSRWPVPQPVATR